MKVPGIAVVSICLAAWEAYALTTDKPTITTLSTRPGYAILIYGWIAWLVVHLLNERGNVGTSGRSAKLHG